jgi:hypothetical protein
MLSSFEEKGKIFTHVVTKRPVDVIFQTLENRIEGKFHIRPDDRLIDELNQSEGFMAITDARVYDLQGKILFTSRFLTVNRSHIVWVAPMEEIVETKGEG